MMTKRRIIAWVALVLFIAIVANILFIHVYVTESAIIFLLYVIFFFFIYNKNSFLYSPTDPMDNEITEDGADEEDNPDQSE